MKTEQPINVLVVVTSNWGMQELDTKTYANRKPDAIQIRAREGRALTFISRCAAAASIL